MRKLFTSESVTEGHPDKVCDQISDAILDSFLEQDKQSRVACETLITTGLVMVTGEITSNAYVNIDEVVRKTISEIGYLNSKDGFDANSCSVLTSIKEQSADIALGVNKSLESKESKVEITLDNGAGDQGMMFGFACDETETYMPMPIYLSHKLAKKLSEVRKNGTLPYLRPDGKTQVTVLYDDTGKPISLSNVVISTQHNESVSQESIKRDIIANIIKPIIPEYLLSKDTKIYVNPTGRFCIGGPQADAGLTGRKIIVDTYGGYASHGGGAFSGKDPTKVDRSGAYMARYIAKNIVAAGLAKTCEIEIAYAIGVAHPVSILVNTYETGKISDIELETIINNEFDLRPTAIIEKLDLRNQIYRKVASYGHFGRDDLDVSWEKLDKVSDLKKYLK